jgi:hypothetical protein
MDNHRQLRLAGTEIRVGVYRQAGGQTLLLITDKTRHPYKRNNNKYNNNGSRHSPATDAAAE